MPPVAIPDLASSQARRVVGQSGVAAVDRPPRFLANAGAGNPVPPGATRGTAYFESRAPAAAPIAPATRG